MKIATFIRNLENTNPSVSQKLYKLTPPMADYNNNLFDFVIVSASSVVRDSMSQLCKDGLNYGQIFDSISTIETYIFPSNYNGDFYSSSELPGSKKGTLNHEEVLKNIDYEIVYPTHVPIDYRPIEKLEFF